MRRRPTSFVIVSVAEVPRVGITLLEVLLSIAVIAILATLVWPSVLRLHGDHQILNAAEKVRAVVSGARVNAIENGFAYQFVYEREGSHFLAIPYEREFDGLGSTGQEGPAARRSERGGAVSGNLPSMLRFSTEKPSLTLSGQQLDAEALNGLADANRLSSLSWSPPILFQSTGSAVDTEFFVIDDRNQRILIRVRGLTGAVTVSRVQREVR